MIIERMKKSVTLTGCLAYLYQMFNDHRLISHR